MRHRARLPIATAGMLITLAVAAVTETRPASHGSGAVVRPQTICSVHISSNVWGGGFSTSIIITNGGAAIEGWTFDFGVGPNVQLVLGWNGIFHQYGDRIVVYHSRWNDRIPSGASVEIGFQGTFTGTLSPTYDHHLNGEFCP
jgi:cellulase/cellobiase CelA1